MKMLRMCVLGFSFSFAAIVLNEAQAIAQTQPTATPAAGGSFQRSSVEGCMNSYLFNGVWRVKVLSLDTNTPGTINLKLEVRNGSGKDFSMVQSTGFGGLNGQFINLVLNNDDTLTMDKADQFLPYNNAIAFKHVPVGGFVSGSLSYTAGPQDANAKPVKLLIGYDPKTNLDKAHYTVKDPSFRVHLDCSGG